MPLKAPHWWYSLEDEANAKNENLLPRLLSPLATLYATGVKLRWHVTTPYRPNLPVICVGNLTMGGAGKTPTAISLANTLKDIDHKPYFLTRGYKGKLKGPHLVNANKDTALDVGDEPLLLARTAPTIVAKDRVEGAKLIEKQDATIIIMDDGFQNPTLQKDFSLVVIDATSPVGNGRTFPAGPLRAPLDFQLEKANALLSIGNNNSTPQTLTLLNIANKKPFFRAEIAPAEDIKNEFQEGILAYCGIGRPTKFFDTLDSLGAEIKVRKSFPDHHMITEEQATTLLKKAKENNLTLVTTEKDLARISGQQGALKKLAKKSYALPIKLNFREQDQENLMKLINNFIYSPPKQ